MERAKELELEEKAARAARKGARKADQDGDPAAS